jgi:rRNA maturation RNase YbeY
MALSFQLTEINYKLSEKSKLKKWLTQVAENHKMKIGELNYVFTNDDVLLHYNQKYLNHHTYTDIITFDNCTETMVAGDIIISVDRVNENAKKFKVSATEELHRVMAHGLLHLLGYKDKKKSDVEEMRKQETKALKLLSIV